MATPIGSYQGMQTPTYPAGSTHAIMQPSPAQLYPTAGGFPQPIQHQGGSQFPQYQQQMAQTPQMAMMQPSPTGFYPYPAGQGPPQPAPYQMGPQPPPYQQQLMQPLQTMQPPPQGAPGTGATLEENRPASIQTPSTAGAPADEPVRRGLLNFFRRGGAAASHTQQQPGGTASATAAAGGPNDPEAGMQQPSAGQDGSQGAGYISAEQQPQAQQQAPGEVLPVADRAPLQLAMVSYEKSCTHRDDTPAMVASLMLAFDVGRLVGQPLPLPLRLTAEQEGRVAREELGLYRERQCVLSDHSLNKMEQRIAKAVTLDRALLAQMAGGSAAAAELQQVAITAQRQAAAQQQQQVAQQQQVHQQLTVGELPTVNEEPEVAQADAGGQEQSTTGGPQLLRLPPPAPPPGGDQTGAAAAGEPMPGGAGAAGGQGAPPAGGQEGGAVMGVGVGGGVVVPPARTIQDPMYAYEWLDENGLMVYVPDPLKRPGHERPARRYDQDKERTRTYVRRPVVAQTLRGESRMYRMDIELGRLEFLVHPAMAQEDLLTARLLALFRDFKRRESVGLVMFYANRLAALEDSMLGAREKLFALQATDGPLDDILDSYAMLAKLEREVAEMRQLKEEEEVLLTRSVRSMERLFLQIQMVRQQQGYALTGLQLTVISKPPQEMAWQQGVLTRERLDALLVAAEMEEIAGLPGFPAPLPVPPDLAELPLPDTSANAAAGLGPTPGFGLLDPRGGPPVAGGVQSLPYGFRLRRCESMCAAHGAVLAEITARLEALKVRPSSDPDDPGLKQLEDQAALVGRAPRRVALTAEEMLQLHLKAAERVKAGEIFVSRLPHLVPVLTIHTAESGPQPLQQHQQQGLLPGQVQQPPGAGAAVPLTPGMPPRPSLKQGGKGRYYVKLYVNGHYVDSSEASLLGDNFVADFKDIFTIQVSQFPESISVMLFERYTLRDSYLGQMYVSIPGLVGSPHVDPQPRPYQFTALTPFRARMPLSGSGPGPLPLVQNNSAAQDPSYSDHTVFPAGVLFVRCGWVSERTAAGSRLMDSIHPNSTITYDNPLAERPRSPGGRLVYDIEAGKELMPPRASVPVDRMLRRAAERIGGKANRAQITRWLSEHVIDPNDPRNAPLLELLKTHEAAASALGDLFRLDIFPDVAMQTERAAEKRMNVLARRWQAGIYRAPDRNLLKGVRSVPVPAPLSAEETDRLDAQYLDQLALLEEASGGTQLALVRVMMARHEKAMQMQIGARLTEAIKEREDRIRAFVLRVRAAAARLAGGLMMARRFRTEDVVNDAPLPQFKLELSALTQLLAPRRPLKRTRKLVKSLMTSVPKDTQLLVTIQRAANLPARMADAAAGGGGGSGAAGQRAARRSGGPLGGGRFGGDEGPDGGVDDEGGPSGAPDRLAQSRNCFVEVSFRNLTQRTVAAPGEFPLFNEQVELDVFRDDGSDQKPQGAEEGSGLEPSPSALQANSDLITFNVFDELILEPSEVAARRRRPLSDEVGDPVRLPERERRFLGCIRVPLSAVYQLQVLEGTFKLEAPPVVLGYVQTSERPSTLTLHMTLRPRLAAPAGELEERITSSEQAQVNRHAQRWLAGLLARPECRARVLKVMATDADGAAVLLCRYVAPTPLPPTIAQKVAAGGTAAEIGGVEALMLKVARFVAHVPYMDDTGIQKRRNDIWTTSSEFLHLSGGDFEEHAHLLAGYFLMLGLQCFLVMGTSICGARSCFVLTTGQVLPPPSLPQRPPPPLDLNPQLLRLWNPVTGGVVAVKDPTGELREVGQLYDGSNIWANTQPTGRPWEMRWNLGEVRDWQPFFGAALPPREIASLQTTPLYEELDARFYEELESRVEKRVEEALSKARSTFVTRPDNKVSRLLKHLLVEVSQTQERVALASLAASTALAESAGKGPTEAPPHHQLGERHKLITALQANHNDRVRRESKAEAVHGHVLALSFSDRYLEAVSEAVTNTGLHRIADDRVKFSAAVFVEPLGASFVCCIWIYIAAIRG